MRQAPIKPLITIKDIDKLDVRLGLILSVNEVADSDTLVKLIVNCGDRQRTILAGIRKERTDPTEIKGLQALFILNLPPREMAGESVRNPNQQLPEVVAIVLSVVAVLVSGYSLIAGQRQHEDERIAELLDQLYEGYAENTVVENWEVSHLDEVPETYEQARDVLRTYATQLPQRDQTRIYLVERGIAIRLLTGFEHLFKRRRAVSAEDSPGRQALLDDEIEYYTDVYLRNPRLLWWWSAEGGGLVHTMDPLTIEFYDQRVLNDPDRPLTQSPDPDGILPGFMGD